jgi:hypothetical protein
VTRRAVVARAIAAATVAAVSVAGLSAQAASDGWLAWTAARAQAIGRAAHVQGRVGGIFDTRFFKTERSYNYKLSATWLTADVIRASARLLQLNSRLTEDEARALVAEAEAVSGTVVMVEIDPREGSGIIPEDWVAFLQPAESAEPRAVKGESRPNLREIKALSGVLRRNYDYDRFWVVFPLRRADGAPIFPQEAVEAELVVRIADREGKVRWPIPNSLPR